MICPNCHTNMVKEGELFWCPFCSYDTERKLPEKTDRKISAR